MKNCVEQKESNDMKQIENFLVELGFICNSVPSAQHLIYSKNRDVVMIKNKKNEDW
jgi:hypothetical protein